jgi:hypothetical protein
MNEIYLDNIMSLPISLLLVCIIGFLAQSIGLCMVRGVNEFKSGKPEFLLALLLRGINQDTA